MAFNDSAAYHSMDWELCPTSKPALNRSVSSFGVSTAYTSALRQALARSILSQTPAWEKSASPKLASTRSISSFNFSTEYRPTSPTAASGSTASQTPAWESSLTPNIASTRSVPSLSFSPEDRPTPTTASVSSAASHTLGWQDGHTPRMASTRSTLPSNSSWDHPSSARSSSLSSLTPSWEPTPTPPGASASQESHRTPATASSRSSFMSTLTPLEELGSTPDLSSPEPTQQMDDILDVLPTQFIYQISAVFNDAALCRLVERFNALKFQFKLNVVGRIEGDLTPVERLASPNYTTCFGGRWRRENTDINWAEQALADAIQQGDTDALLAHIQHGVNPNGMDAFSNSMIHLAVVSDHLPMVETLLDHNTSPDGSHPSGFTNLDILFWDPLLANRDLTKQNHIFDILLDVGATIRRPETLIALFQCPDPLDYLVDAELNDGAVLALTTNHGYTIMHMAAAFGSASCCDWIEMRKPHLLNQTSANGVTPLHMALIHRNSEAALWLLCRGCRLQQSNICIYSELFMAAVMQLDDVVRELLDSPRVADADRERWAVDAQLAWLVCYCAGDMELGIAISHANQMYVPPPVCLADRVCRANGYVPSRNYYVPLFDALRGIIDDGFVFDRVTEDDEDSDPLTDSDDALSDAPGEDDDDQGPDTAGSRTVGPVTTDSYTVGPDTLGSRTVVADTAGSYAGVSHTTHSHTVVSDTTDSGTGVPDHVNYGRAEPGIVIDLTTLDSDTMVPDAVDSPAAEIDTEIADIDLADTEYGDTEWSDTETGETEAADTQAADTETADTGAADTEAVYNDILDLDTLVADAADLTAVKIEAEAAAPDTPDYDAIFSELGIPDTPYPDISDYGTPSSAPAALPSPNFNAPASADPDTILLDADNLDGADTHITVLTSSVFALPDSYTTTPSSITSIYDAEVFDAEDPYSSDPYAIDSDTSHPYIIDIEPDTPNTQASETDHVAPMDTLLNSEDLWLGELGPEDALLGATDLDNTVYDDEVFDETMLDDSFDDDSVVEDAVLDEAILDITPPSTPSSEGTSSSEEDDLLIGKICVSTSVHPDVFAWM
ncbi:hypothetical protein BO71DRAFT_445166 [Aspergillus ellipticus CBS 707.79]|uniref:Uncharacterized protein n=1 Tax=Aspergillus ellipticus CBS 707.79 TaxID=1448320 RepID=A0A319D1Z1_9EURO|nr:hypothetical protein BO71DRAFT_445166 [Aspergillus ellipticus CBS 707.79]